MENVSENAAPQLPRPEAVNRALAAITCLAAVLHCLVYDHFRPHLPHWWRESGGGIPYVVFWITFGFALLPCRRHALPISVVATLGTCLLEFLQLWQPAWLTGIRATTLGAALLGGSFSWGDFPPYFVGGMVGYGLLLVVSRFRGAE